MAGFRVEDFGDAKGRRVVADRAFRAGEVVVEDDAYAFASVTDQLPNYCDCCLAPINHPLRCSACKAVWYLSKEHQARAWRAGHREECAALHACMPRMPPTAVRLALRCALRHWKAQAAAAAEESSSGNSSHGSIGNACVHSGSSSTASTAGVSATDIKGRYEQLLTLRHHWDDLPDECKLHFAQMGAMAHQLLQAGAPQAAQYVGPRDLTLLIARFGANSHTISDGELQPLAVGIFPTGALVNHDCTPNTCHTFRGSRMLFRAVRDIRPGEEITTSYTELAAVRWERRQALLEHHLFDIDAAAEAAASGGVEAALAVVVAGGGVAAAGDAAVPAEKAAAAAAAGAAATEEEAAAAAAPEGAMQGAALPSGQTTAGPGDSGAGSSASAGGTGGTGGAGEPPAVAQRPGQGPKQQRGRERERAAALQCLPQQDPVAAVPLLGDCGISGMASGSCGSDANGSSASSNISGSSRGELRLYACSLPPWPHDQYDCELTAVVEVAVHDGGGSSGGSIRSGTSTVVGSMWGCLQQDSSGLQAAAARAACESFGVNAGLEDLEGSGGEAAAASASWGNLSGKSGCTAADSAVLLHFWWPGASATTTGAGAGATEGENQQQQGENRQEQQQQDVQQDVVQGHGQHWLAAVRQLATHYAAALRLQQGLGVLLAAGQAAAAADKLQRTLRLLGGDPGLGGAGGGSGCAEAAPDGSTTRLALGPSHVLRMRLLADIHRASLAAGRWEAALSAAHQLLPLYQQAYPPAWPQLGLLWASAAKLAHLLERPKQAAVAAAHAIHILEVTHSSGSSLSSSSGGGSSNGSGSTCLLQDLRSVQCEAQLELQHLRARCQLAAPSGDDEGGA